MKVSKYSDRSGFVLVMALVIMTFVFAAAASLLLNRRMAVANQQKVFYRAAVDASLTADAAALRAVGQGVLANGGIFPVDTSISSIASEFDDAYGLTLSIPRGTPYPKWDASFSFYVDGMPYDTGLESDPARKVPSEVFWGMTSFPRMAGVYLPREVPTGWSPAYASAYGPGSKLRAWSVIEGAAPVDFSFRKIPISVFTLFVGRGEPTSTVSLSSWLSSSASPYNFGGYSVGSVGVGRLYVEAPVQFNAALSSGFPLVVESLVASPSGSISFLAPSAVGGGSVPAFSGSQSDFGLYALTARGMLATFQEAPNRLLRYGLLELSNGLWGSEGVGATDFAVGLRDAVSVVVILYMSEDPTPELQVRIVYDPVRFSGSPSDLATFKSAFSADTNSNTFIFAPPSGWLSSMSIAPDSVYLVDDDVWKMVVDIPSVAGLGNSSTKFTVVGQGELLLRGGFNRDNSGAGAMVVSPKVTFVDDPADPTPPAPVFGGVLVTEANQPSQPAYAGGSYSSFTLNGSLVLWGRVAQGVGTPMSVQLVPDVTYLTGERIPPLTPSVFSFSAYTSGFQTYEMQAIEPEVEEEQ